MCNETYTNLFKNDHTTLLWSLFSNTIAISWRKLSLNTNFGIVWTELVPRTLRQRIFDPRKQSQFEEEFHIYIHQTIAPGLQNTPNHMKMANSYLVMMYWHRKDLKTKI